MATFADLTLDQKIKWAYAKKAKIQTLISVLERKKASLAAPTNQEITAAFADEVTPDQIVAQG